MSPSIYQPPVDERVGNERLIHLFGRQLWNVWNISLHANIYLVYMYISVRLVSVAETLLMWTGYKELDSTFGYLL